MKKVIGIVLCLILAFGLCACESKDGGDLEKVSLVLDWTPYSSHAGIYVAKEEGYFEEEGIDLEIVLPPEDGAVAMVASGQAQFGIDFQDSLAAAFDAEPDKVMPVTAIAAVLQHNTSGIISLKEKGITSFDKLEGMTYASYQLPTELKELEYVMEKEGGDFDKLNVVPNAAYDAVSALSADADCIWVFEGWEKIACERAGLDCNFMKFTDIDKVFDYYTPVIIGNNDYMTQNVEIERGLMRALTKGYEYCVENPESAAEIFCGAVPELDEDLVKESLNFLSKEFIGDAPCWGYIDSDRWNRFYDWMYNEGLLEHNLNGIGYAWG